MFKKEKAKNVRWTTLMKVFLSGPKWLKKSHKKNMSQRCVCPRFVANPCGQAKLRGFRHKKSLEKQGSKLKVVTSGRFERSTYCLEGSCSIQLSYGTNVFIIAHFSKIVNKKESQMADKPGSVVGQSFVWQCYC